MKLALLNPHGWEVLEGERSGLQDSVRRAILKETFNLHARDPMNIQSIPSEKLKIEPSDPERQIRECITRNHEGWPLKGDILPVTKENNFVYVWIWSLNNLTEGVTAQIELQQTDGQLSWDPIGPAMEPVKVGKEALTRCETHFRAPHGSKIRIAFNGGSPEAQIRYMVETHSS